MQQIFADEVPSYEQAVGNDDEPLISFPPESPVPSYDEAVQTDGATSTAVLVDVSGNESYTAAISLQTHRDDEPLLVA